VVLTVSIVWLWLSGFGTLQNGAAFKEVTVLCQYGIDKTGINVKRREAVFPSSQQPPEKADFPFAGKEQVMF
jgi:hypothetical protein